MTFVNKVITYFISARRIDISEGMLQSLYSVFDAGKWRNIVYQHIGGVNAWRAVAAFSGRGFVGRLFLQEPSSLTLM